MTRPYGADNLFGAQLLTPNSSLAMQSNKSTKKDTPVLSNKPGQLSAQKPMLPSIAHLIEGKSSDLVTSRHPEDALSVDEDEEDAVDDFFPGRRNKETASSKNGHSKGRITDRVPKLEEKMKRRSEKFQAEKRASDDEVHRLQMILESEKAKCSLLEDMLEKERADRLKVEKEVEVLKTISEWS